MSKYESSPEYLTATVLSPNARPVTLIMAFPFSTFLEYSLPLISIVTVPVAPSGKIIVTVSVSPTLISKTSTLIGVEYFGTSTLIVVLFDE